MTPPAFLIGFTLRFGDDDDDKDDDDDDNAPSSCNWLCCLVRFARHQPLASSLGFPEQNFVKNFPDNFVNIFLPFYLFFILLMHLLACPGFCYCSFYFHIFLTPSLSSSSRLLIYMLHCHRGKNNIYHNKKEPHIKYMP